MCLTYSIKLICNIIMQKVIRFSQSSSAWCLQENRSSVSCYYWTYHLETFKAEWCNHQNYWIVWVLVFYRIFASKELGGCISLYCRPSFLVRTRSMVYRTRRKNKNSSKIHLNKESCFLYHLCFKVII